MNDRDRLIEIIYCAGRDYDDYVDAQHEIGMSAYEDFDSWLADDLLANGVIVQKQGEWKIHQNDGYWHYDCPFCDDGYATKEKDNTPPNFCGNCGAKLKERVDNG